MCIFYHYFDKNADPIFAYLSKCERICVTTNGGCIFCASTFVGALFYLQTLFLMVAAHYEKSAVMADFSHAFYRPSCYICDFAAGVLHKFVAFHCRGGLHFLFAQKMKQKMLSRAPTVLLIITPLCRRIVSTTYTKEYLNS